MKALVFEPGKKNSARLAERPPPSPNGTDLIVQMIAVGVCGTDRELLTGDYGWAPVGKTEMIIGHETVGRVVSAPARSQFKTGDLVAGIVRRPDPVPCPQCGHGEWDMCTNGLYTERGIKEIDGFCSDFYSLEENFAVKLDPTLGLLGVLVEPTSVVAKAWDHIERIGHRSVFTPKRVLVTGAGPIGLLAAMIGRQKNFEVHVLDRVSEGLKPDLVRALGAHYHFDRAEMEKTLANKIDLALECTGNDQVVLDVMRWAGPGSIVCLAGVSSGGRSINIDFGSLNKSMVLENEVVFGSVNANRRHYKLAAEALGRADVTWLSRLITRRIPLSHWEDAFRPSVNDIKVVLTASAEV